MASPEEKISSSFDACWEYFVVVYNVYNADKCEVLPVFGMQKISFQSKLITGLLKWPLFDNG